MRNELRNIDLTVVVTSGTGSQTFNADGEINTIGIKAPSAGATYKYRILDADSYPLTETPQKLTGDTPVQEDVLLSTTQTFTIFEATDGTYNVRIRTRFGV